MRLFHTVIILLMALLSFRPLLAVPRIDEEALNSSVELGDMQRNSAYTHVARIRNTGDAALVIKRLSCCCGLSRTYRVSSYVILPGEEETIEFTVHTGSMAGRRSWSCWLITNDPDKRAVKISLIGNILWRFDYGPEEIRFDRQPVNSHFTRNIIVRCAGDEMVTSATASAPSLTVDEVKRVVSSPDRTVYEVVVGVGPVNECGNYSEQVHISTSSHVEPTIVVPVVGSFVGNTVLKPESIFFGVVHAGEKPSERVEYLVSGNEKVEVTDVTTKYGLAAARIVETSIEVDGKRTIIEVELDPKRNQGNIYDEVEVYTTTSGDKPLVLPVSGFVLK